MLKIINNQHQFIVEYYDLDKLSCNLSAGKLFKLKWYVYFIASLKRFWIDITFNKACQRRVGKLKDL